MMMKKTVKKEFTTLLSSRVKSLSSRSWISRDSEIWMLSPDTNSSATRSENGLAIQVSPKETILFLGGIRDGEYENLLEKGFHLIVVVDNYLMDLPKDCSSLSHIEKISLNPITLGGLSYLQQVIEQHHIHTILCVIEDFLPAYASLLAYLNTPGLSSYSVEQCANKTLMHQRFVEEIGITSTAQYQQIDDENTLLNFAHTVGYPVVIKPNGLYSSFFISCNKNEQELRHNFHLTQQGILAYLNEIHSQKNVLIQAEEYLMGSNHSVDCIVLDNQHVIPTPVVDVLTGYDIGGDDFHHFARIAPSALTVQEQKELVALAIQGVKALKLSHCIAHVELIYTPKGSKLLEIAARPGGNRIKIMREAFGIDLMMAYYHIMTTPSLHFPSHSQSYAFRQAKTAFAVVTPFPKQEGYLAQINENILTEELSTYSRHYLKKKTGDKVGTAKQGYSSPLSIELKSNNRKKILQDIQLLAEAATAGETAENSMQKTGIYTLAAVDISLDHRKL